MPLKNFPRPGTARGMLDSRYHKYNKKLPGRYLSELSPNSMPLADAKVHLARARLAFQKKLRRLDTQFKLATQRQRADAAKGIIKCPSAPTSCCPTSTSRSSAVAAPDPDPSPMKEGDVYWRVVIGHLKRIKFNPNDGLDEVELALIAAEFAVFDADGDGIEAHEISAAFKSFDKDGDGDISTRELASVMRAARRGPPSRRRRRRGPAAPEWRALVLLNKRKGTRASGRAQPASVERVVRAVEQQPSGRTSAGVGGHARRARRRAAA